ncbi:MAG: hypothetical protein H6668_13525 [Ardenticatenaceae bacterium]|nr:hypothetical protein [Ardenticatenaceae bacterium]
MANISTELPGASPKLPLRVLEIGTGIGNLRAERLVNHNMLDPRCLYGC